jgi:hypothetical protein
MRKIFGLVGVLVILGTGCIAPPVLKSVEEIASVTESLDLETGSKIILKQTVLGIDGTLVDFLGGESAERRLTLTQWSPGDQVALHWSMPTRVETDASIAFRSAYDQQVKSTPIGTKVPPKPKAEFETKTRDGNLASSNLANAHSILLPVAWPEGDGGIKQENSLVWISTEQYDELVKTKKTVLNLGLFDDSIAFALGVTDRVNNLINTLKKDAEKVQEKDELLSIQAGQDWGMYTLLIDEKEETVRTIEASNWFGRYTILANRDNPLILEVVLSPASKGSLNIFSRQKFLNAFAGYKIAEVIKLKSDQVEK